MKQPDPSDFFLYEFVIRYPKEMKKLDKSQKIRVNRVKEYIKYTKRVGDKNAKTKV